MGEAIYPWIGFLAGLVGGWFWQNLKPGIIAAIVIALLVGAFTKFSDGIDTLDYMIVGLGVILAALTSFFGTIAGTRLKDHFKRKSE